MDPFWLKVALIVNSNPIICMSITCFDIVIQRHLNFAVLSTTKRFYITQADREIRQVVKLMQQNDSNSFEGYC